MKEQWEWLKSFWAENSSKKLCSFTGRITRREYIQRNICFSLLLALVIIGFVAIVSLMTAGGGLGGAVFNLIAVVYAAFIIVLVVITLSIQVRRLHDFGWSGWMILLGCIPVVNVYMLSKAFGCRGTVGVNKYGEDKLPVESDEVWLHKTSVKKLVVRFRQYLAHDFVREVFSLQGRLSRREYFYRCLGIYLPYTVIVTCVQIVVLLMPKDNLFVSISIMNLGIGCLTLLCLLIFISYDIKRNHDRGNSGWYSLLFFIPVIDLLYLGKQFSVAGARDANKYGTATTVLSEDGVYLNDDF